MYLYTQSRGAERHYRQQGWEPLGVNGTYVSASSFTVPGDYSAYFGYGFKIKAINNGSPFFGILLTATFGAGVTTFALIPTSDYGLVNAAITDIYFSDGFPIGFPINFSYTTTTGAQAGTFAAVTVLYSRFSFANGGIFVSIGFQGSQTVANANYLTFTVPKTSHVLIGYIQSAYCETSEGASTTLRPGMLEIQSTSTTVQVFKTDRAQYNGAAQAQVFANFIYY